ncbi:alpha/beta fold hydrolase [Chryseobacterium nematophagum]|uniref:Alpha/beta fold hydrolase n=1 Tax=Chryseobacterium nematophagum TaxID=2305228 RepID=A0A3M7TFL4_9FLAO|nr:alpha/beta fold hydrolase [Chryseobacterium nematophagum]RNA61894.1 alpha/beta fold hydrolase [Chryseobacterium nematophagum]
MEILNSKIFGENLSSTPLLVFHGLFGMLDNWGTFGKDLGEKLPVHLIDLRNHGRSFHSDSMTHDDLANDIADYMNHYGIEKAHVLGHSLGGKAVMQFAIQYPEKVDKLIVVDISPKAYPPHHQGIIKALKDVDFNVLNSRNEVEVVLSQYIPEKSVIQFLTKNLYWNDDKKLAWRFNLKTLSEKYNEFVSNAIKFGIFEGETLFIAGEKSNYILPQDEFAIKQQFPKAKIIIVTKAGHWVQAENPIEFMGVVTEFLFPNS